MWVSEAFSYYEAFKKASLKVVLGAYSNFSDCLVYIDCVPGFILFMYLDIFAWMESENLPVVHDNPNDKFYGDFGVW